MKRRNEKALIFYFCLCRSVLKLRDINYYLKIYFTNFTFPFKMFMSHLSIYVSIYALVYAIMLYANLCARLMNMVFKVNRDA